MESREELLKSQEQLLECPFCRLEQPPDAALWNPEETSYETICQACGRKFYGTIRTDAEFEWSAS
jgi:hypothetical protein